MTNEEFEIRSNIARLEARLSDLMKHEKTYPFLIAKTKREIEKENKRLEELNIEL